MKDQPLPSVDLDQVGQVLSKQIIATNWLNVLRTTARIPQAGLARLAELVRSRGKDQTEPSRSGAERESRMERAEDNMSGHMVSVESGGVRHLFMANIADPEQACGEVSRKANIANAQLLAPLAAETLEQFEVPIGEVKQFYSDGSEGLAGEGR